MLKIKRKNHSAEKPGPSEKGEKNLKRLIILI
jgi:hypothetical protein